MQRSRSLRTSSLARGPEVKYRMTSGSAWIAARASRSSRREVAEERADRSPGRVSRRQCPSSMTRLDSLAGRSAASSIDPRSDRLSHPRPASDTPSPLPLSRTGPDDHQGDRPPALRRSLGETRPRSTSRVSVVPRGQESVQGTTSRRTPAGGRAQLDAVEVEPAAGPGPLGAPGETDSSRRIDRRTAEPPDQPDRAVEVRRPGGRAGSAGGPRPGPSRRRDSSQPPRKSDPVLGHGGRWPRRGIASGCRRRPARIWSGQPLAERL